MANELMYRGYKNEPTFQVVKWLEEDRDRSFWVWDHVQLCGLEAVKNGEAPTAGKWRLAEDMLRFTVLETERLRDRMWALATVDWVEIAEEWIHCEYDESFRWESPSVGGY